MLDYFRLGGVDIHAYDSGPANRELSHVDGLVGLSEPRKNGSPRVEQHGSTNRSRFLSEKIVSLEGEIWGDTMAAAYTDFRAVQAALYGTLTDPLGKLVTWREASALGIDFQAYMRLAGPILPPLEEGAALLKYQVALEQMDPRAYTQTLRSPIGAALSSGGGGLTFPHTWPLMFLGSGGGTITLQNDGFIETPPVLRIYGYCTSPRVQLVTTGEEVVITGEIAAGDYLELDHAKRTVRLNGNTKRMNLLNGAASSFFDVPNGVHTARLLATNFDAGAHLEGFLRDAYGG